MIGLMRLFEPVWADFLKSLSNYLQNYLYTVTFHMSLLALFLFFSQFSGFFPSGSQSGVSEHFRSILNKYSWFMLTIYSTCLMLTKDSFIVFHINELKTFCMYLNRTRGHIRTSFRQENQGKSTRKIKSLMWDGGKWAGLLGLLVNIREFERPTLPIAPDSYIDWFICLFNLGLGISQRIWVITHSIKRIKGWQVWI